MKKFLKKDAKDFFFASKYATSLMNLLSVVIGSLVVIAVIFEFISPNLVSLSPFFRIPLSILLVLLDTYCAGTVLFAFIVYISRVK